LFLGVYVVMTLLEAALNKVVALITGFPPQQRASIAKCELLGVALVAVALLVFPLLVPRQWGAIIDIVLVVFGVLIEILTVFGSQVTDAE
jgi:hypothetical protein